MKKDDAVLLSDAEKNQRFDKLCNEALALGFLITDFVSVEMIVDHYRLISDQAMEVLAKINLEDYDNRCINANVGSQDGRREVLDAAVKAVGFSVDDDPELSSYGAWLLETGRDESFVGCPEDGVKGAADLYEAECRRFGVTPDWN